MAARLARYSFISQWQFTAPVESVWAALVDPAAWPIWWPGLKAAGHTRSAHTGIGDRADFTWRAPSGYMLKLSTTVTRLEPNRLIEFAASGDLIGSGSCQLTSGPAVTVTIRWDVATSKPWMNRFARLLGPIFALNHRQLMAAGQSGLRRYLH